MFERRAIPRVFGCAPGVDFPTAVIDGLERRMQGQPPETWARVTLIVNTRRMARRLQTLFETGPPRLLPRVRMLTDLEDLLPGAPLPRGHSPLRRRLELANLVSKLIALEPNLAPEASAFDLADSLATLIDEMQGEGISADQIAALDVTDQSGHWLRAQRFFGIAQEYIIQSTNTPDPEARQRATVLQLAAHWADAPPPDPILIVGSTGSRGTTQLLMQAVARLPQGALVLPGFDATMPDAVWGQMDACNDLPQPNEDHPQYRFRKLMELMGIGPQDIGAWSDLQPPSPERNALVSLALRPAPVTNSWRIEGGELGHLITATQDITLIEAESPRAEALAIAMRLRAAAEVGQRAALITPDRMLTRQVAAALDRWNIVPDDSAGTPLHLSPPGSFLRHVAELFLRPLDAETLLTLLKHPLTHAAGNSQHGLETQRLELGIRKHGLPYPNREGLIRIAGKSRIGNDVWTQWLVDTFCDRHQPDPLPLSDWVRLHLDLAQTIAEGHAPTDTAELWKKKAGQAAQAAMTGLETESTHGGTMTAAEYAAIVYAVLNQGEDIRDRDTPHPDIMIWGTLEARVQGADLVILGGLNDGTWPESPAPDPWMNRKMRMDAGLLLPERRIGLSAHDFQQAIAAREVWLTRSIRSDDAETVPSRWVNRLQNLMKGLPEKGGPEAWEQMQARGQHWLRNTRHLDRVPEVPKAPRPAPCPPVATRPRHLSVTEIERLIRDPYAIYAKHCLRLKRLNPLVQEPDALLRGIVSHDVQEQFVRATVADPDTLTPEHLIQTANQVLARDVPWPAARALWQARFDRVAEWFVETERDRQMRATPTLFEDEAIGRLDLPSVGMTLEGRADRIDIDEAGRAVLYDYKTGNVPTKPEQTHFNKQLLIEAAMIEAGGFSRVGPRDVLAAEFIGIGSDPKSLAAPLDEEPGAKVLSHLTALLAAYLDPDKGYTARRAFKSDRFDGPFDHLARLGEWDVTDAPVKVDLT